MTIYYSIHKKYVLYTVSGEGKGAHISTSTISPDDVYRVILLVSNQKNITKY